MNNEIPNIKFNNEEADNFDWRKIKDDQSIIDNDEELEKTPQDIIDELGFDPKDI